MGAELKSQDVLVALKLVAHPDTQWTYKDLAASLCMSASEVHQAQRRLERSRLYNSITRSIVRPHLKEFLLHGVRYAFPAEEGDAADGILTALSVPPLKGTIIGAEKTVWPVKSGPSHGLSVFPLYRSAPAAALQDPSLHEWLALVDVVRIGRVRERRLAQLEIERRLS